VTARFIQGRDGNPGMWVCTCGSKAQASFNLKNKFNCPDEERSCVFCFKESLKNN